MPVILSVMIKRISRLATVTMLVGACTVGAMSIAASEASSSSSILEFGSNGKRNMLYDARQRPQAVLLHGRLYIVYNGDASATKNGKGNAYPMFISYDPQSRKFSEPARIGPKSTDHHYSPIIWADESDYLHVLHGCHRTPGTHLVSSKPVAAGVIDVTWKKAPRIAQSISYPTVYRIFDDKEVMAYRVDGHTGSWTYRTSEDNGKTWTGPEKDVTDLNGKGRIDWSSYRTVLPSRDRKYLHMVYTDYDDYITKKTPDRLFNPRYDQIVSNEWKYNLHYVKINLQTHEVVNADGKVLKTPIDIDYSMKHCLIWNTEWRGAGIPPVIALGPKGEPTFLHILTGKTLKDHHYYYVRRENGQWRQTEICRSNHNWNGCYLSPGTDGTIHAYLIVGEGYLEGGYMDGRGGGGIEEWTSDDKGNTWKKRRDLTPDRKRYPGWRFNHIQPVVQPDGEIVDGMLLFYGWKDEDAPTGKGFLLHE